MVPKTKETKARLWIMMKWLSTEKHFWLLSVQLILLISIGSRSLVVYPSCMGGITCWICVALNYSRAHYRFFMPLMFTLMTYLIVLSQLMQCLKAVCRHLIYKNITFSDVKYIYSSTSFPCRCTFCFFMTSQRKTLYYSTDIVVRKGKYTSEHFTC